MFVIQKRKLLLLAVLLIVVSLFAIGCGGSSKTGTNSASSEAGTIKIGVVGPFTGTNADYGKGLLQGAEIAAEEWNAKGGLLGKQIEFVKGDAQGDSKQATTVANKFVSQGIKTVIGPTFTNESLAANPIFEQAQIVAVSGVTSAHKVNESEGSSYFFRTIPDDELIAVFAAEFLKNEIGAKKVAYINDGTAYTDGAIAAIKGEAEKLGLETVFDEGITPGEPDYTATITKLKSIAPDVVVGGTFAPEGGLIQRQAAEGKLGIPIVFIMGNQNPTFTEVAGAENAKGVLTLSYPTPEDVESAAGFVAKVEEKYHETPDTYAHYWYDAATALFKAIKAAGTMDGPKVREALMKMEPFEGATGTVTFTEKGNRKEQAFLVKTFDGTKWMPYQK